MVSLELASNFLELVPPNKTFWLEVYTDRFAQLVRKNVIESSSGKELCTVGC